jgi:hypothetical protein
VTLYVGPDASIPQLLTQSERIWARFADAVTNGPPEIMIVSHDVYAERGVSAIAMTVPLLDAHQRLSDNYWIVLGRRFFAATEDCQILTLLHECIHIRLHAGPLRERTQDGLIRKPQLEPWPAATQLAWDRWDVACKFRNFCDEILAEQYLKARFPDWFSRRWAYYLQMRRDSFNGRFFDNVEPRFRALAMGYEILRNQLGSRLADDATQRDEFQAMEAPLHRGFEAGAAPDEQERLARLVTASADLVFRHGPPFDLSTFDQTFDWVRTLR